MCSTGVAGEEMLPQECECLAGPSCPDCGVCEETTELQESGLGEVQCSGSSSLFDLQREGAPSGHLSGLVYSSAPHTITLAWQSRW